MSTVVVAGASGVVGRAALEAFTEAGWRTIGLSRRRPDTSAGEHVALDLTDREACEEFAVSQTGVTHVVYAALFEKPGLIAGWREADQMQTNLTMLRNLMEPLFDAARGLRHVSLLQGTKAYGAHVGPMRVPGKEREPRVEHANFYWLQEDWLKTRQQEASWHHTIWRPPVILGHAIGAPMNLIAVLGAYAALGKALGEPLSWPGGAGTPMDMVDAGLLARALVWAATHDAAADQTFNVSNGDVLLWERLWPRIAEHFDMPLGAPERRSVAAFFAERARDWDQLVTTHGLQVPDLHEFLGDSTIYADVIWNTAGAPAPPSTLLSTIKLRHAGFHECLDSEDCVTAWLERLQKLRILPGRTASNG